MFNTFKMSFWTLKASNTSQCIEKNYQLIAQIDFFFHKRKSNGLGITKMGKFRNVVYSYYSFKTHQTFSFSCMSSKNSSSHSLHSTRYSWIRPPNLYWTHTHTLFPAKLHQVLPITSLIGHSGVFSQGLMGKTTSQRLEKCTHKHSANVLKNTSAQLAPQRRTNRGGLLWVSLLCG